MADWRKISTKTYQIDSNKSSEYFSLENITKKFFKILNKFKTLM